MPLLRKTTMQRFLRKLIIELPFDSAILLLDVFLPRRIEIKRY